MHSLEHATSPATTLLSVWSVELRFGIVYIGIENRTIGAHSNNDLASGFPGSDSARLASANVEVRGRGPFLACFGKPRHENRLVCFLV